MYKSNGFNKRRSKSTSSNRQGWSSRNRRYKGSSSRGRRLGNQWGNKNRRRFKENIAHSRYISKPDDKAQKLSYVPNNSFNDFKLAESLSKNIANKGYEKPTKIQDQAIPEILKGRDLLGIASTGSGKTAAFLIPMINKVINKPSEKVLIITPTRELATQINNEFKKFTMEMNIRMALIIGGANIRTQIKVLKTNPNFIVATPGRLIDIENRGYINLKSFNNVVLDEVDRMLDMGFVKDIKNIIYKLSENRQSLFFSATMSAKEEGIANSLLNIPVKVESHKQSPLKSIRQDIIKVKTIYHKLQVLQDLLKKPEFKKVLVFSGTKYEADNITKELRTKGISVDSLHGNKTQSKRSKVLQKFRHDKIDVLVATDVAARGIDIPDISHVINYDEPANFNDYIHRIGRTGRIGKTGNALTFVVNKHF